MSNDPAIMLKGTLTALAKQWNHVREQQTLLQAYKTGWQHCQDYYGEPLVSKIYEDLKKAHVFGAIRDTYVLVEYYPYRFFLFAKRKFLKLTSTLKNTFLPKSSLD